MNRNVDQAFKAKLYQVTKEILSPKRWEHVSGVIDTSLKLADIYGGDKEKIEIAALLHDYAKEWSYEQLLTWLKKDEDYEDLIKYDSQLWHAPVAARIAREEFAITDQNILAAIRYHTTGRENMSIEEKIVCLADYIEPNRKFSGVEEIREVAYNNLNKGLLLGFNFTINYLIRSNQKIHPLTILTRNSLLEFFNK